MEQRRLQKRLQSQSKINQSGYYYFIYDLEELNGEDGLNLPPQAMLIPFGQEFYNILLQDYPNIVSGYPRTFSLKNKLFAAKDFSLNILMMAHRNYILNLGYENKGVDKMQGLQKFYNNLTQNPKLWQRVSNVYDQRFSNYLEQTKKIKKSKELNRNFILTNILYGTLSQFVADSIQLSTTESLDLARRMLKFACEIQAFYQTTEAYRDNKTEPRFNRENNLSDFNNLVFVPMQPFQKNLEKIAKQHFENQEYTSAREWYEILAIISTDIKQTKTYKMLANISKSKENELITAKTHQSGESEQDVVVKVEDKLDALLITDNLERKQAAPKKKKVRKVKKVLDQFHDESEIPNFNAEETPQILDEPDCESEKLKELDFDEIMFGEDKIVKEDQTDEDKAVKEDQAEVYDKNTFELTKKYKNNYWVFFYKTKQTKIIRAVIDDIEEGKDPYLHRQDFAVLGNVVYDDNLYSSTTSVDGFLEDIYYFEEASAIPLVETLLNHFWKDQQNIDIAIETQKMKFEEAGNKRLFPACLSLANVTFKGKNYAFIALSGSKGQGELREALSKSIEEYNLVNCKNKNFVEMVFLDGPIWNHSLMMNNIYRHLYNEIEDLYFRKSCAEKILFSTCTKCFYEDPNFRINGVANVPLFPYKRELNQQNRLIQHPYADTLISYRDRDIVLKNGFYTIPICCCNDCGQIKDSSLINMMSAKEAGRENRSVIIQSSKSRKPPGSFLTSPIQDSVRTRTTMLGDDISRKGQKRV